jgi:hypothetical protein
MRNGSCHEQGPRLHALTYILLLRASSGDSAGARDSSVPKVGRPGVTKYTSCHGLSSGSWCCACPGPAGAKARASRVQAGETIGRRAREGGKCHPGQGAGRRARACLSPTLLCSTCQLRKTPGSASGRAPNTARSSAAARAAHAASASASGTPAAWWDGAPSVAGRGGGGRAASGRLRLPIAWAVPSVVPSLRAPAAGVQARPWAHERQPK